ncbi:MAG TPA: YqiJ family protein [Burkholderiales bacterium]|nr:YqiJ family protein [Burkholderiales bacterium]
MSVFLAPESWPFLVATIVLVAITVIEGLTLLVGFSAAHWFDHFLPDTGAGMDGAVDNVLGWLHVGRVPILILIVIFLAGFATTGFALNAVAWSIAGSGLPAVISAPLAFLAALPIVRAGGAVAARLIPRDETFAVSLDSLVGRVAAVVSGTARHGFPAQAKVTNEHGQTLYVMVEPDDPQTVFPARESVLLVRRVSGIRFVGIRNPRPDLL